MGGFTGLQKPGQTFYFSRTLSETLDSPMLQLDTGEQGIAVFLDMELIYTDYPELDNRIGYLTLPPLSRDRAKPVVLSLPLNYQGKTLTVAQSSGLGEKSEPEADAVAYLCKVTLNCGFSYESGLITESFRTAIPAALCFGTGVLLLAVFLWQFFSRKTDWVLLFLALASFLWCTQQSAASSFTHAWFGTLPIDVARLAQLFSLTVLLLFLTNRLTGKHRIFFAALTALQAILTLPAAVPDIDNRIGFVWQSIPEWISFCALIAVLPCMGWEWKRKNLFSRFFCPAWMAGITIVTAWTIGSPGFATTHDRAACFRLARLLTSEIDGADYVGGGLCRAYGMDNERNYLAGRNKVTGTAV